jgi:hypothetical protein
MPDLLPPVGVTAYNGVTFGARMETKNIDIKPVYDAAGRTVVYNLYSLTIDTDVYVHGQTADTSLEALRRQLLQPAVRLDYTTKGLGNNIVINNQAGGDFRECIWGPKPQLLSRRPVGTNQYVRIVWRIDWAVADCPNPLQKQSSIMEFCYKVSFDIDKGGYTNRTYSGFFRSAQTRKTVNDRTLQATADQFREQIIASIIPGFRRTMAARRAGNSEAPPGAGHPLRKESHRWPASSDPPSLGTPCPAAQRERPTAPAFSHNGAFFATADEGGRVVIWDAVEARPLHILVPEHLWLRREPDPDWPGS